MTETTSNPETENPQGQQQIPAFTPDDLVLAIQLIDEGVNQGAYKGWENVQKAMQARTRLLMFAQHWQNTINQATEQSLAQASAAAEETKPEAAAE